MSQTITNKQGESVEVLDQRDLNGALWKLIAFLFVVGLPTVIAGTSAMAETRRDIVEIQRELPDQKNLRRTMDSLLVELRATRKELQARP